MNFGHCSVIAGLLAAFLLAISGSLIGCDGRGGGAGGFLGDTATPAPTAQPLTDSQKAAMASYIKVENSKPESVAAFYQQSTRAIKEFMGEVTNGAISPGRRLRTATVSEVIAGISVFGTHLFEGVEKLLSDEIKSLEYFAQFKAAWLDLFLNLAEKSENIVSSIEAYIENVDSGELVVVIDECITKAKEIVEAFLPAEVYEVMDKYFDGVVEMFKGFSRGWHKLSEFMQADGVVEIYEGVRGGLELVLPGNMANHETYLVITGILDDAVAGLSKNVAKFTKRLTENKACWREKISRENTWAHICQDGYHWDGSWQCVHDENGNSRPAFCNASSGYTEIVGEATNRRCYKECDEGLEPWNEEETQCVSTCSGERGALGKFPRGLFSSDWEDMCGTTPQVFADIQSKITLRTLHVISTTVDGIVKAVEAVENKNMQDVASSMHKIVESVLDWAAEFVFPFCGDAQEEEEHPCPNTKKDDYRTLNDILGNYCYGRLFHSTGECSHRYVPEDLDDSSSCSFSFDTAYTCCPPTYTDCPTGYSMASFSGYWSNAFDLQSPYGKVISKSGTTATSATQCAAMCDNAPACIGFNLYGDEDCYIYDTFGSEEQGGNQLTCLKGE